MTSLELSAWLRGSARSKRSPLTTTVLAAHTTFQRKWHCKFLSFRDFQRLLSCSLPVCLQDGTFQFRGNCYTIQPGFFWGIPKWCQGKWAMQKGAMSAHYNIGCKLRDHKRLSSVWRMHNSASKKNTQKGDPGLCILMGKIRRAL